MNVNVPLGNTVGLRGLSGGPAMHSLAHTGQNATSTLLTRKLTQLASDLITGPTTGSLDAILGEKDVCNDIMTIFIGDRESLINSVLGQVFTVSYAHEITGTLFDQFWIVAVSPAPVKHKNIRPDTSRSFLVERAYDKNTRQATMQIDACVAQTIQRLERQLREYDVSHASGLPGDGWDKDNVASAEKMHAFVKSIINQLTVCFAPAAYGLKKALNYGVSDEAVMIVTMGALPLGLAETVTMYQTTITDHMPGLWEQDTDLHRSLVLEYERQNTALVYGLAKHPDRFMAKLIEAGHRHVQKIAYDASDRAVVLCDGASVPIDGILVVSAQTYSFLVTDKRAKQSLHRGRLANVKPVYHKPMRGLAESDTNKIVRVVHDTDADYEAAPDDSGLVQLIDKALDPKKFPVQEDTGLGLVSLTSAGRRILANKPLDEAVTSSRPSKNEKFKLCEYNILKECAFIMYGNEAVVLAPIAPQALTQPALPDHYGRSPSLVALHRVMFRATVGDINADHDLMRTWATQVCEDRDRCTSAVSAANTLFTTKAVSVHTPAVSSQRLTFGANELKTVLLDPSLYDPSALEVAINANIRAVDRLQPSGRKEVKFLTDSLQNLLNHAHMEETIFKRYFENVQHEVNLQGTDPLHVLNTMELTPFHSVEVVAGTTGKYTIRFSPRRFYLAQSMIDTDVMLVRAAVFLSRTMQSKEIRELNQTLADMMTISFFTGGEIKAENVLETPASDKYKNMVGAADKLADKFTGWTSAETHGADDLNFLFAEEEWPDKDEKKATAPKNWLLMKYVLMVLATRGRVKFGATPKMDKKTGRIAYNGDVASAMTPEDTLYAMFADDSLHPTHKNQMAARSFWIVTKSNWPPVLQAAALIMEYWLLTPMAMAAQIDAGIHVGFAVDFVKEERLHSEQAIYTKRGAYEFILAPAGKETEVGADESVVVLSSFGLNSTRNTLGAGAVIANMTVPNPNAIPGAEDGSGSPVVSTDYISRTARGTLTDALAYSTLPPAQRAVIESHLRLRVSLITQRNVQRADSGDPEQFVGLIRPPRRATEKNVPLMGLVSDLIPASSAGISAWTQFYSSSQKTANPYASNFGGCISMRYTRTHTAVGEARSYLMKTTCFPGDETTCTTTSRLERLYDMNTEKNLLTPEERDFITHGNLRSCRMPSQEKVTLPAKDHTHDRAASAGMPADMGLAVPYTQSTRQTTMDAAFLLQTFPDTGYAVAEGPTDHTIVSPYTAPPLKN